MTILEAFILGAVQGVSEFLPVSSSGHLVVLKNFFQSADVPLLFDVLLHVATLLVVIIVFRKKILQLLSVLGRFIIRRSRVEDKAYIRIILVIFIATLFTVAVALFVKEIDLSHSPKIVSLLFLVTAGLLIAIRFAKPKRKYEEISIKDGIIVGIAQGVGVFPGISRSGITISTSLFSGIDREAAGEFSFIISIPAILGALVLELKDAGSLVSSVGIGPVIVGFITSFLVGLGSLLLLLRLIKHGKLYFFAFYLIPLGILGFFFF